MPSTATSVHTTVGNLVRRVKLQSRAYHTGNGTALHQCETSTVYYTPCLKNVPPLACYNFDAHEWILIFLTEMLLIN